ncbi:hypothetical protein PHLGIDRAFT_123499 [Phlebiopsis gigantea 11061_1 CR5-6]|uniref:Cytochrome P450 n=1 Tax=Phlebiopsis gigantea (strain 11061_1 CR5-6) TaxID=745531 RepID=A0A0C3RPB4_PHLG1|nr:hypothetical protein PHLGIDRAFT_123499 [Phlebiopsis gigantea 11061_1 CR5-6]
MDSTTFSVTVAAFAVVLLLRLYYVWLTHHSISHIRGPETGSKLLGNIREIAYQENVGDLDWKWLAEYGTAWRLRGPLLTNILVLAAAKALQHVLQTAGYKYPKTTQNIITIFNITGRSILWAPTGDIHARHRRVMNPAFSTPQLRSFLPLFRRGAGKLTQLWKDQLFAQAPQGTTMSVTNCLARTTLDVIGEAAFDFDFGALDQSDNEVSKAYDNMFADSQLHPSVLNQLFQATWSYLPQLLLYYVRYLPTREYARYRQTLRVISSVSQQLIRAKSQDAAADDASARDIMSILVRANASEDARVRLSAGEMAAQMSAMMLAGHETAANTLAWLLWELARHPACQDRLRAEIAGRRREAVLEETLRYHPIAFHIFRVADQDDVIPLAEDRLPSLWGDDAQEWNPERFLERNAEKQVKVGMFANLMTFSAGVRSCIGWRFAVIEQ